MGTFGMRQARKIYREFVKENSDTPENCKGFRHFVRDRLRKVAAQGKLQRIQQCRK